MATSNLRLTLKHSCKTIAQIHQLHAQAITTGLFSLYPYFLAYPTLSHILKCFTTIKNFPEIALSNDSIIYITRIFNLIPNPLTFHYNSIIRAHTLLCSPDTALILFREMLRKSIAPDSHTFPFVLKACGIMQKSHPLAKALHAQVTKFGILDDVYVQTTLSCTYGKSGDVDAMKGLFDGSLFRNVVIYTTMIDGFAKAGQIEHAAALFHEMPRSKRDIFCYNVLINGFVKAGKIDRARKLFNKIPLSLRDVVNYTNMIDGFAKAGQIKHAADLFDEMPRSKRNVLSYNVMINGFMTAGKIDRARKLFSSMPSSLRDVVIYTTMIDGFAKAGQIEHAVDLFNEIPRLKRNVFSYNVMINGFMMAGKIDHARELFDGMPSSLRNAMTYNTMIDGFAKAGEIDHAREVFDEMPSSVKNVVSYNALIGGFCKIGHINHARVLFDKMPERDTVSWHILLAGYIDLNLCTEAIELFDGMMDFGVQIKRGDLLTLLSVCTQLGNVTKGKEIHDYIKRNGIKLDKYIGTALVDLYAKCGCIEMAEEVFRTCCKEVVSWNAMLMGLAMHGHVGSVLRYFSRMLEDGVKPNEWTILAVLLGCNHSGLINDATRIFVEMERVYGVPRLQKHYVCMVDLFARAGLIKEAREMIERMPMKANVAVWRALLGGCKKYGDVDGAEEAAKHIIQLKPENDLVYSSLAHLYANLERWDDLVKMRRLRNCSGIKKRAGCCTIELGGITHKFFPGDRSHPCTKEIYLMLNDLQLHKSELLKDS